MTCRIRFTAADQPVKFLRMHIIAMAVGGILLRHRVGAAVSDRLSLFAEFRRVPGSPGAGAHPRGGLNHRAHHLRVLCYAEVIVRAPDHHIARPLRRMPDRMRKPVRQTFEISENAVAPLVSKLVQSPIEKTL